MPELPEVETMRRGVVPVVGSRIEAVERVACQRRPIAITPSLTVFARRVVGQRIVATERIGKRVLLRLEGDDRIVFEPRMTGLVLLADPPTREHLRFQMQVSGVANYDTVLYWDRRGLGSVSLVRAGNYDDWLAARNLGPDALTITATQLRERLRTSRRSVKVALLDQQAVAGVGNLYASEILYRAGIRPTQRCHRLSRRQWEAIHQHMQEVLEEAIRYEGSTLSDGTYRNALNQSGSYQNHHRVYDRANQPCRRCATPIRRIVQAQRATFYCPQCQS